MVKEELDNKDELEDFLTKIDVLSMVATLAVSVGFLAHEPVEVAAEEIPKAAEEAATQSAKIKKSMLLWCAVSQGI
jgi:hypothetical protein